MAILPFDNQTPEPVLTKEVNDAITEAIQGRLGLRPAAETRADAVVRGRVLRYDSDVPIAFQPGLGRADVTKRQVQLTVDVEIVDQRSGKCSSRSSSVCRRASSAVSMSSRWAMCAAACMPTATASPCSSAL